VRREERPHHLSIEGDLQPMFDCRAWAALHIGDQDGKITVRIAGEQHQVGIAAQLPPGQLDVQTDLEEGEGLPGGARCLVRGPRARQRGPRN